FPWTWAARRTTSAWCAAVSRRSRRSGTGGTATTSTSRWSTSPPSVRAAARSRPCVPAPCSSGRRARARSQGPPVTALAANAPRFSALGLLVADYVVDLSRAYVSPLADADPLRMRRLLDELADEAAKELAPAGLDNSRVVVECYAGLCYPGQNFDLQVPVPAG